MARYSTEKRTRIIFISVKFYQNLEIGNLGKIYYTFCKHNKFKNISHVTEALIFLNLLSS